MKALNFAQRNFKEIIRDPLSLIFSVLLPLFLLFIFQQFNIPNEIFNVKNFTPGIIIFSFSFITLFTATLVAKDRTTSFLTRLFVSPMKPSDYIIGYIISFLPIVLFQNILFFSVSIYLGLSFNLNIVYTILATFPISIIFIALGIFIGCITTDKSASGVASIIIQFVAFTSGMYFPIDLAGKFFANICNILPFAKCVDIIREILNNTYQNIDVNAIILLIYLIITVVFATLLFKRKMVSDNK